MMRSATWFEPPGKIPDMSPRIGTIVSVSAMGDALTIGAVCAGQEVGVIEPGVALSRQHDLSHFKWHSTMTVIH